MLNSALVPSSPVVHRHGEVSVRHLPVNLFGAVMGLSGLALAWRLAHASLGAPAVIGECIGAFALGVFGLVAAGYLAKLARHPDAVRAEFQHPVVGHFFGTIAISVLLLSGIVAPYSASAAQVLWTVGVLASFTLSALAAARMLRGQADALHAVPAWLISGVATLDIPVTGGQMAMTWAAEVNLAAAAVGGALALLLLAMIVSRLVHRDPLAPAMAPSLMIVMAPFAVGFLAYVNITGNIDRFAALLFYFGLFLFVVIAPKVFRRSVPFSAAWWAVSFPFAALVNAALKYAAFRNSAPLWALAMALLAALSLVLAVLTVRTVRIALNGRLFR
jgi:tellurite resistance protein